MLFLVIMQAQSFKVAKSEGTVLDLAQTSSKNKRC
ncbi:Variable outer membrane protein (plasmid) [Borrelia hermsii YBT]|uniref:Variable outer membrane protein n=1 Tax=Borrelia hermsii YBT TaxID=1313295 RepID=W5T1L8_BORHE|nr:Variable outer membrane protein [Borrelia hermsii YBT]